MKAVVMAGGEGSRLRPMTCDLPKPLLPVAGQPIMEHVLRLLGRHGMNDTVVTVQFLAALIKNRFGNGEELGMRLHYAHETTPLGTAGSVLNAEAELRDDTFLVISGDALTDIDLTELIAFHRAKGALATVCLTRVPDPLEFGITVTGQDGRVERFLEKPTWGQVFTDTVNTGIYVMEPEIFDYVPKDGPADWAGDVFPRLLAEGKPVYGYVADGYWEDIGTQESYLKAHTDILEGRVRVDLPGFETSPGIRIAQGAEVHPEARLHAPCHIGAHARVEAGAVIGAHTVLGPNTVVAPHTVLEGAIVHEGVYLGPATRLRGCVIGQGTSVMSGASVAEGAVVGATCTIGEDSIVTGGVRVYPEKAVEAGAVVHSSLIRESRNQASLFGPDGVSGILNVEMTAELMARLAGAYATTLPQGASVTVARDDSPGGRALSRAFTAALQCAAVDVRDIESVPLPVARRQTALHSAGGVVIRTVPGTPERVTVRFLDEHGGELSPATRRKLDRVYARQEYRTHPSAVGSLHSPAGVVDSYADTLLGTLDTSYLREARLKIVVDAAHGSAGALLPQLFGALGIDALVINTASDTAALADATDSDRLAELVTSARAAFGARIDPAGERLTIVDDQGRRVAADRAPLVLTDLVTSLRPGGRIALPGTVSRVAERLAAARGTEVLRTAASTYALTQAVREGDVRWAADGRGGFVVPAVSTAPDAFAALLHLAGLLARSPEPLSSVVDRTPVPHVPHRTVPTPWEAKGALMRTLTHTAPGKLDGSVTEGVRIVEGHDRWVMVVPDPAEAVTHLWAEAPDQAAARALLERWALRVGETVAAHTPPRQAPGKAPHPRKRTAPASSPAAKTVLGDLAVLDTVPR